MSRPICEIGGVVVIDECDTKMTPEEIEEFKRMLGELIRGMSDPITSNKRRKPTGLYEWDTEE